MGFLQIKDLVGTDSHREVCYENTGTSGIKNFINKYKKKKS
jgi:hypothetical protein